MCSRKVSDHSIELDGVCRDGGPGDRTRLDPVAGGLDGSPIDDDDDSCATILHLFVDSTIDQDRQWRPSSASHSYTRQNCQFPELRKMEPGRGGSHIEPLSPLDSLSQSSLISSLLHESVNDPCCGSHFDLGPLSCGAGGTGAGAGPTSLQSSLGMDGRLTPRFLEGLCERRRRDARGGGGGLRRAESGRRRPSRNENRVSFLLPACLSDWKDPSDRATKEKAMSRSRRPTSGMTAFEASTFSPVDRPCSSSGRRSSTGTARRPSSSTLSSPTRPTSSGPPRRGRRRASTGTLPPIVDGGAVRHTAAGDEIRFGVVVGGSRAVVAETTTDPDDGAGDTRARARSRAALDKPPQRPKRHTSPSGGRSL